MHPLSSSPFVLHDPRSTAYRLHVRVPVGACVCVPAKTTTILVDSPCLPALALSTSTPNVISEEKQRRVRNSAPCLPSAAFRRPTDVRRNAFSSLVLLLRRFARQRSPRPQRLQLSAAAFHQHQQQLQLRHRHHYHHIIIIILICAAAAQLQTPTYSPNNPVSRSIGDSFQKSTFIHWYSHLHISAQVTSSYPYSWRNASLSPLAHPFRSRHLRSLRLTQKWHQSSSHPDYSDVLISSLLSRLPEISCRSSVPSFIHHIVSCTRTSDTHSSLSSQHLVLAAPFNPYIPSLKHCSPPRWRSG